MTTRPCLTGFRFSVYTRAVRIALAEKGVGYDFQDCNPFAAGADVPHPFGRVPVLDHAGARIYETAAITAYVDAAFGGPDLIPAEPLGLARVVQVTGIVDAYAYWPLVRQVYSHAVFRPAFGEVASPGQVDEGMAAAPPVLGALEDIAREGLVLGGEFTRADCHLAPMIAAFASAPVGADLLAQYPALAAWWARVAERASVTATDVPLPGARG